MSLLLALASMALAAPQFPQAPNQNPVVGPHGINPIHSTPTPPGLQQSSINAVFPHDDNVSASPVAPSATLPKNSKHTSDPLSRQSLDLSPPDEDPPPLGITITGIYTLATLAAPNSKRRDVPSSFTPPPLTLLNGGVHTMLWVPGPGRGPVKRDDRQPTATANPALTTVITVPGDPSTPVAKQSQIVPFLHSGGELSAIVGADAGDVFCCHVEVCWVRCFVDRGWRGQVMKAEGVRLGWLMRLLAVL